MIEENELRKLIREYCQTELPKAKVKWVIPNIENIRQTLNRVKESGDYESLREALQKLHSGKNIFRYHIKTTEDLKNLWENFLKEVVETPPEKLLENIDERFERWKQIKGIGKGLISEVLAFYYPQYFAPWNNIVDLYFQELGRGKPKKYSEVLKHLRELKGIFKEECKAEDINFIIVDNFGWWLQVKVATKDLSKNLSSLLKKLKEEHKDEWTLIEKEFRERLQRIKELTKKGGSITEEEFEELLDIVTEIHNLLGIEVLWLWGSAKAPIKVSRDILSRSDFQELMQIVEEINDIKEIGINSEIIELILRVMSAPHVKLSTLSSWLFVFNPKIFYPIHEVTLSENIRKKLGINKFWESKKTSKKWLKEIINRYLKLLSAFHIAAQEAGINDMAEAVFYLTRYSCQGMTNPNAEYYLEITKPPWPGHLGKYLWAPHDEKYWNGREGKIGSLKKGDIIIHDWKGKIVGYSTVRELPRVVTKEELVELFKSEGIWNSKYQEFAKSWFKKSRDGKFYLVKLSGLNEFNEHQPYSKIKGLPQPTKLQGVYLVKLDPEVGRQLVEVPKLWSINLMTYLASKGYHFPDCLVAQFYTALKTKGFVILSGLTGSGKTKIIQEFAKLLDPTGNNFLFLPVRPDWRDSKPLLGYYNPLTGEYHKTPLLEFIINALRNYIFSKDYLNTHKAWFIRCGEEGEPNKYASIALDNGYISIGWHEIQDMRKLSDQELETITQRRDRAGDRVDPLGQTLKFFKEISIGDIILMPLEKSRNSVAIGIVSSDYYYVQSPSDGNPQKHRRKVMWLGTFEIPFMGIPVTVQEIRDDTSFLSKKTLQEKLSSTETAPYFLLLDEMNLAHVEYYFADFLSVLESGRDDNGFTRESIKIHNVDDVVNKQGIPKEIKLPPNLYIIGTVNMDETTYTFSPKVLDRAFTIEFHEIDLENYPPKKTELSEEELKELRETILADLRRGGKFLTAGKDEIEVTIKELKEGNYWQMLHQLNKALEPYDLHFGYRVVDEIALFFKSAKEAWEKGIVSFESDDEIFDLALLMKVLPKFHGNRKKLEEPLREILKLCLIKDSQINPDNLRSTDIIEILRNWESEKANFRFKHVARKALRMLRQLYEIGFASFS